MNPGIQKWGLLMNKHYAELTLLWGTPLFIKGTVKPGRLQNLFKTLQKETEQDLHRMIGTTNKDWMETANKLEAFMHSTGWYNKSKHIMTFLSFLLAMIENSESKFNPKITETLNKIVSYFEAGGEARVQCFWAGDIAAQKFNELF